MPPQRTAVFPATFDPVTNGHLAIIARAVRLFDRLVVGVYDHGQDRGLRTAKQPLFDAAERVSLVTAVTLDWPQVRVRAFTGLSIDFARQEGAAAIVRGLRVADDFEFERQMAMMNRHLDPDVETVLFITNPDHAFVSSSLVREVAQMGGDVSRLVPPPVAAALARRLGPPRRPAATGNA